MHNDNNNNETETREVPPAKFCLHSINKSLKKEYINVAVAVGVGVAAAAAFAIKHIDTERAKRWELAEVGPFWGPIIIIIIIGHAMCCADGSTEAFNCFFLCYLCALCCFCLSINASAVANPRPTPR